MLFALFKKKKKIQNDIDSLIEELTKGQGNPYRLWYDMSLYDFTFQLLQTTVTNIDKERRQGIPIVLRKLVWMI